MILREPDLQFLIRNKDSEKVKILCGMRGSGKTQILSDYRHYLREIGVSSARIFHADLSLPTYRRLSAHALYRKIYDAYPDGKPAYIFLDDILRFDDPETLIDRLFRIADFDLYLTADGSEKSLSALCATLPGRLLCRTVYPFSYAETVGKPGMAAFLSYAERATLPAAYGKENEENILDTAVSAVMFHEIMEDDTIRKTLLEKILAYLSPKTGNTIDTTEMARHTGRTGRPLLMRTLFTYLSALEKSGLLLIVPVTTLGKETTPEKHPQKFRAFFPDAALMRLFGEDDKIAYRRIFNTVAVELFRRSDHVLSVETETGPIDFLTEKNSLRTLIQCIPRLDEPGAAKKIQALSAAPSAFKKVILTLSPKENAPDSDILTLYLPTEFARRN